MLKALRRVIKTFFGLFDHGPICKGRCVVCKKCLCRETGTIVTVGHVDEGMGIRNGMYHGACLYKTVEVEKFVSGRPVNVSFVKKGDDAHG